MSEDKTTPVTEKSSEKLASPIVPLLWLLIPLILALLYGVFGGG